MIADVKAIEWHALDERDTCDIFCLAIVVASVAHCQCIVNGEVKAMYVSTDYSD